MENTAILNSYFVAQQSLHMPRPHRGSHLTKSSACPQKFVTFIGVKITTNRQQKTDQQCNLVSFMSLFTVIALI